MKTPEQIVREMPRARLEKFYLLKSRSHARLLGELSKANVRIFLLEEEIKKLKDRK